MISNKEQTCQYELFYREWDTQGHIYKSSMQKLRPAKKTTLPTRGCPLANQHYCHSEEGMLVTPLSEAT